MSTPLDASQSSTLAGGPSFSLANRMARVLWGVSWLLLARWTPPPCHRWRRFVLKRFGARIAPGARVHASVRIWLPANLSIGEDSLIGPGAHLYNQGHIAIGSGTVISQGAYICASSHDVRDPKFQLVLKPVRIGDGCWVAADAFVGPGVHIGDGAVLAARGALFSDAQAGGIYRGNPAAFVRARELREGS
ncbi:putative colanic acid biosynthesis acetyltransferase [Novosphingobium profundi]|uniref:DapH/DapD/GlmU-related protein n=1 Tax=Novosphingobium profundi TaxID=1774954 RepID=UPI001BDA15AA|nr:DapH/DapD/GlmU-related protein [Novosphingobium profundi]MBT0668340.1 putative colanic acid biosynthesis acetyltransferase [Novosphingobium profundi]